MLGVFMQMVICLLFSAVIVEAQPVFLGGTFYCQVPEWIVRNEVPREGDGITIYGPLAGDYWIGEGPELLAEFSEAEKRVRIETGTPSVCQECRIGHAIGLSIGNLTAGSWTIYSVSMDFSFAFEVLPALQAVALSAAIVDGQLEVSWDSVSDREYVVMDTIDFQNWGNFQYVGGTGERITRRIALSGEARAIRVGVGPMMKTVNLSNAACGGRDI